MKTANTGTRRFLWLWSLVLALCLAGCMPSLYGPAAPPPPPPAPTPPPPPQVGRPIFYVTVNRLNLRACPGMDCPKISVLERNEEVERVGDAEDWSQIRVKRDGRLGWVNSRYLSKEPLAAAPAVAPPPGPTPPAVVTPPPLPERPPAPVQPVIKKKAEEAKPAKPAEAAEPPRRKPAPAEEKPAPKEEKPTPAKPAPPPAEKPAPPPEPAEPSGRIRIM